MKVSKVQQSRIAIEPPVYYCHHTKESLVLDGRLDKAFWEKIPFSDDFVDLSGRDLPAPRFRTRMKMCWDDENLYIGAILEGDEIWATLTERDSIIYFDNDFEVFLDPSSSTHDYMELEVNAFNTQWDLMLTRGYRDGGHSISGWDMKGVETAVYVEGRVNDPSAENRFWSVEIKIPFAGVLETYSAEENPPERNRCLPVLTAARHGDCWRMNFSRVQWQVEKTADGYRKQTDEKGEPLPEDNWVWAPTGMIDIHVPEFWGYVFFTEEGEEPAIPYNELMKTELRSVYYAEHKHFQTCGRFTADPEKLGLDLLPEGLVIEVTRGSFLASCPGDDERCVWIREDGYVWTE